MDKKGLVLTTKCGHMYCIPSRAIIAGNELVRVGLSSTFEFTYLRFKVFFLCYEELALVLWKCHDSISHL